MALAALLVLAPGGAIPQRTHFRLFAAAVSAVSLIAFVGAVPVVPDSSNATHAARAEGRGGLNLRAAPIVLAAVTGFMLSGLFTKSLVYFAKYALLAPRWTTRAIILAASGQFVGAFGWRHAARYIPTIQANRYAYAATACTAALLALSAGDRARIEAGVFVLGVMVGGTNMFAWALLPAIVDQFERGGERAAETSVFAAFTCLSKVAVGMSGWLLTRLLGAFTISPTTLVSPTQGRQLFIAAAVLMGVGALTSLALLVPLRSGRRMAA
jgi:Na+/melibiose symporter-like transporter